VAPAPASSTLIGSRKNGSRSTPWLSTRDPINRKASRALNEPPSRIRLKRPRNFFIAIVDADAAGWKGFAAAGCKVAGAAGRKTGSFIRQDDAAIDEDVDSHLTRKSESKP
jgi:hypothetical protein